MLNQEFNSKPTPLRSAIDTHFRMDETACVQQLLQDQLTPELIEKIQTRATSLVMRVREQRMAKSGVDAFMFQYSLSSDEGIALMCLAESLLRIPDKETIDKLIRDKLTKGDWRSHLGKSESIFVNAATFGLMLTGKVLQKPQLGTEVEQEKTLTSALKRLTSMGGEPIVRKAVKQAMKILGKQFVLGRTIQGALKRSQKPAFSGYRFSFDMLGEAALTQRDAEKYLKSYQVAIAAIGAERADSPMRSNGISVKLSALHPCFKTAKKARLMSELLPILKDLILRAKAANINFTIDAEEAHTLILNLDIIEAVITSGIIGDWAGFGMAVQAYQKAAPKTLDYIIDLARKNNCKLMVRLVKGAYWDTEIKLAQVNGMEGYPVFTRKQSTDLNYIHCVKKLLDAQDVIYPQFATHNALTLATIIEIAQAKGVSDFEFQCLHGMGASLYDQLVRDDTLTFPCRVYAPVGTHEDLLAYLVRRLLENGANTSFVNRIVDAKRSIAEMVLLPETILSKEASIPHPQIPQPVDLFKGERKNSMGLDLNHPKVFMPVLNTIAKAFEQPDSKIAHSGTVSLSPIDNRIALGAVTLANESTVQAALDAADKAWPTWRHTPASTRAQMLENMGDLLHANRELFYALLTYEGGKTLDDAVGEVREAIDFCNYYAMQARKLFASGEILTGPTGEINQLCLDGRGIIACISPWNFPLAIFLGQVTAALAAGNCVIAKPASQTVLIAVKAVELLHQAGFPQAVVQLVPGSGSVIGNALVKDTRVQGIVFTGSTQTARDINLKLAQRDGAIVPFIAETGGQNAMIVDSSALPEQVVQDVMTSAFRSAGQRCSALRVLFVQDDIADKIITMIQGAMQELNVGHPGALSTDLGPVIDHKSRAQLQAHVDDLKKRAKLIYQVELSNACAHGSFFAPTAFEIPTLDWLKEEVFGPVLHIVRFKNTELDQVLAQIKATGFGLTLGVHSRIEETVNYVIQQAAVGNIYVNRNMIGAVVGVQPFGGVGLSGTGPKAGGPYYLPRLAHEKTVSINTTASGGNTSLMSMQT